ncbi:MAG: toprim domain-containing protein, partial [Candidatus Omnitrophota bacterium]
EKVTDLDSIEKTGLYNGLYHVLGGAINPLDGITQDSLKIKELANRVNNQLKTDKKIELIIATNPNTPGETTSLYIKEIFQSAGWRKKSIILTRLARGLASGSNLEYADEITLKHALEYRK